VVTGMTSHPLPDREKKIMLQRELQCRQRKKLGDVTVIAMQGNAFPVLTADICQECIKQHP